MLGRSRPFYKAGPVMRLEKIAADVFAAFVEARFAATSIRPEPGLGAAIVELAGNLPYDVQRLAHEMWDDARAIGRKAAALDDLHATLRRLLGEQETLFEAIVAAADARAARRAARRRARGGTRAAVGRRARPLPAGRRLRPCRRRSPRSCARMSSPARDAATSSWIRCCANGSRGGRSRRLEGPESLRMSHVLPDLIPPLQSVLHGRFAAVPKSLGRPFKASMTTPEASSRNSAMRARRTTATHARRSEARLARHRPHRRARPHPPAAWSHTR